MLRCHLFQVEHETLLNDIKEIDEYIITYHKNDLDQTLLHANGSYRYDTSRIMILLCTVKVCIYFSSFLCKVKTVPPSKKTDYFSFSF